MVSTCPRGIARAPPGRKWGHSSCKTDETTQAYSQRCVLQIKETNFLCWGGWDDCERAAACRV